MSKDTEQSAKKKPVKILNKYDYYTVKTKMDEYITELFDFRYEYTEDSHYD